MKSLNFKLVLGVAFLIIAAFFIVVFSSKNELPKPQADTLSNSGATASTTIKNVQTVQSPIEGVKVPDGWYSHETYGIDHAITVLSRTNELPKNLSTEQISISKMTTSLSPEQFAPHEGVVADDPTGQSWSWGIYKGHKTFSLTSTGDVAQWSVYVFGGDTVYEFSLSPNDTSNSNLEKDRENFWKVITYYVQDSAFEKLPREETQSNCKIVTLTSNQEPVIQAEPDTGYVALNFIKDGKKTYTFLNFNDDLSQCTPNIEAVLTKTKVQMSNKAQ